MTITAPRLSFPRLRRIDLSSFTLYSQQPDIGIVVPEGVLCVAGANGIGKSTFLAAVNFAITGRVPPPTRSYSSANEYYEQSLSFAAEFFEGRISERDRGTATISVELHIGGEIYQLTRAIMEPGGLRTFLVLQVGPKGRSVTVDGATLTDEERQQQYAQRLTAAVGLKSFQQFVFLQHFVLTFDETRSLLFWDPKALDAALYLAFGGDPDDQQQSDQFRRQMEREDSKARNSKWQALRVRKRIDDLRAAAGLASAPQDIASLEEKFEELEERQVRAIESLSRAEERLRDGELKFIDASAGLVSLRKAYSKTFAAHVGDGSRAAHHPLIIEATTAPGHCDVCGKEGASIQAEVAKKIARNVCPLCETPYSIRKRSPVNLAALRELDQQIAAAQSRLDETAAVRDRTAAALDRARAKAAKTDEALRSFEAEHQTAIGWLRQHRVADGRKAASDEIASLNEEVARLTRQSKLEYAERDKWKAKLFELRDSLRARYRATEQQFVPLFRHLAERFLGMELDINVETRGSYTSLVLELRSSPRRDHHQLSESQRFFLDIALRMALAQFCSKPAAPAGLFVDTPEGSLDIAYEARAGEMFAEFVNSGHDLLMTANVNTSQLLKKLAESCGSERMTLARMTEWGELSDVQLEEEELFIEAYASIERALRRGGAGASGGSAKRAAASIKRRPGGAAP